MMDTNITFISIRSKYIGGTHRWRLQGDIGDENYRMWNKMVIRYQQVVLLTHGKNVTYDTSLWHQTHGVGNQWYTYKMKPNHKRVAFWQYVIFITRISVIPVPTTHMTKHRMKHKRVFVKRNILVLWRAVRLNYIRQSIMQPLIIIGTGVITIPPHTWRSWME